MIDLCAHPRYPGGVSGCRVLPEPIRGFGISPEECTLYRQVGPAIYVLLDTCKPAAGPCLGAYGKAG